MEFYKARHSLLILREQMNEYVSEQFILERTDADKSQKRIAELKHLINDLQFAIEVLETYKD